MLNMQRLFCRKNTTVILTVIMAVIMAFGFAGCDESGKASDPAEKTDHDTIIVSPQASSADLYCLEFNTFSGVYVEDGKNEKVENVATILVENRSKTFLDRATVKYKYGDKTATFLVTGLPAGRRCWVMEADKLETDGEHSFEFEDCISAFKEDAVLSTDKLLVKSKDNKVTVKNISDTVLNNVCLYYKNTHDDGNLFGGITYMMNFGNLEPGKSFTKASGHYSENTEIVRYSFQEELSAGTLSTKDEI